MNYIYETAKVIDCWDEAIDLIRSNHEETGALEGKAFKPDKEAYVRLDEKGAVRAFTMRRREGAKLVGYGMFFLIEQHLHYPGLKFAYQDALFVRSEDRGPQVVEFIKFQDLELHRQGVSVVLRHVKPHRDYSGILVPLGYKKEEVSYLRVFFNGG